MSVTSTQDTSKLGLFQMTSEKTTNMFIKKSGFKKKKLCILFGLPFQLMLKHPIESRDIIRNYVKEKSLLIHEYGSEDCYL